MAKRPEVDDSYLEAIEKAKSEISVLLKAEPNLIPKCLRLALNDALTYDASTRTGGSNGSIRVDKEQSHPANAGLKPLVDKLASIKIKHSQVTNADIIHLAGVIAAQHAGAESVVFVPGRRDSRVAPPQGRLISRETDIVPGAAKFRRKLDRLELSLSLGIAILGAHPLGFALGSQCNDSGAAACQLEGESDPGSPWIISNVYFQALEANAMPELESHRVLLEDPEIKALVELYANNNEEFLRAYSEAHTQLSLAGTDITAPVGRKNGDGKTMGGVGSKGVEGTGGISSSSSRSSVTQGWGDWCWYAGGAALAVAGATASYLYITKRGRRGGRRW